MVTLQEMNSRLQEELKHCGSKSVSEENSNSETQSNAQETIDSLQEMNSRLHDEVNRRSKVIHEQGEKLLNAQETITFLQKSLGQRKLNSLSEEKRFNVDHD